jgi:acyl-CoA synthetase (NDP forming)
MENILNEKIWCEARKKRMDDLDLDRLFHPKNIAMIGASATFGKWGSIILFNILNGGFDGNVYPVNPKQRSIMELTCYPTVGDIPEPVDLAMITTPAKIVPSLIDECGAKGVPYVIVVTSNFSETGPEGARLEHEIVKKARSYGMRIVGPNTMGIFSASLDLHALMPPVIPLRGPVSMLSQSGNLGTQMLAWGESEGVGFEKFVSSGNEGDLTCIDYLKYFAKDDATKVILAYLEGVGPDSELLLVAREIARKKPIIVFKGGRTTIGEKAAASHSGAMAGSSHIYRAVFRQAGMIEAATSQGLMDCAKAFSSLPVPRGNRVAILTRGGGWGVITADACEENGLVVPPLPDDLVKRFNGILPEYWSHGNPIDMVAVITPEPMLQCLEILAKWEGIDAIIVAGGSGGMTMKYPNKSRLPEEFKTALVGAFNPAKTDFQSQDPTALLIKDLVGQTGKPIINVSLGSPDSGRESLEDYQPVSFPTPERAVRVLRLMAEYRRFLDSPA